MTQEEQELVADFQGIMEVTLQPWISVGISKLGTIGYKINERWYCLLEARHLLLTGREPAGKIHPVYSELSEYTIDGIPDKLIDLTLLVSGSYCDKESASGLLVQARTHFDDNYIPSLEVFNACAEIVEDYIKISPPNIPAESWETLNLGNLTSWEPTIVRKLSD